jgi:CDGSH-type Zn-finger protein
MKVTLTDNYTEFLLEPGETVALCRCGKSDAWPLCDGRHKKAEEKSRECTPAIVSGMLRPEPVESDT